MNELNTRVEVCDLMGGYDMQFPVIFFCCGIIAFAEVCRWQQGHGVVLLYVAGSRVMISYYSGAFC